MRTIEKTVYSFSELSEKGKQRAKDGHAQLFALLKACQEGCADQFSDETFSEMCDANEYEFFENGELA